MSLNFVVLYGSVRSERQGIKFARFMDVQLRNRGHASTLIDPLEYRLPLLDKMYKEYPKNEAPEQLEAIAGFIRQADGFLVVSASRRQSECHALDDTHHAGESTSGGAARMRGSSLRRNRCPCRTAIPRSSRNARI